MTTGLAIRTRAIDLAGRALGRNGKTTADASGTDHVTDAIRWKMAGLAPDDPAGAFIRINQKQTGTATSTDSTHLNDTSAPFTASGLIGALVVAYTSLSAITVGTITANSTTQLTVTAWSNGTPSSTSTYVVIYGYVGKVQRLDPATGKLYIDPAVTTLIPSGTTYELWYHGIWPDDVDRARDQLVLPHRTPIMRTKPLSVLAPVEEWSRSAYSATTGGVTNATATPAALDFPEELFTSAMQVANSDDGGLISSERYRVQPNQIFRVWGRVSVAAQTASIRVRDLTNSADITLAGATTTFTLAGWQWFDVIFTIPSGCGLIQVWLGGSSASCDARWAGVGMLPTSAMWLSLATRVLSKHDVGRAFEYVLPISPNQEISRQEIQVLRDTSGDGVTILSNNRGIGVWPIYYQERHRYAALQSDWMTAVDRVTGDVNTSDVNVDYAAWALMLAVLEPLERTPQLNRLYLDAAKNGRELQRQFGMDPLIAPEFPRNNMSGIPVFAL